MKKICKTLVSILITVTLLSAVFVPVFQVGAASLTLNKTSILLVVGGSYKLKFNKNVKSVKWTVSDKRIATVSQNGVVKGIGKGSAVVSAKIGSKAYKCKVSVEAPKISLSKATVAVGKSLTLKLNGTKRTPKWYTKDSKIATVNSNGVVKALKPGNVNIFARLGGKNYICRLTATKAASGKLSRAQIIKYLQKADELYDGWICHGYNVKFDYTDEIMHNGSWFAKVDSDKFRSVSQLEKELKKYFSKEIYEDRLNSYYCMHNGKLYGIEAFGQGGDIYPVKLKLIIYKRTNNYCSFCVMPFYDFEFGYDNPFAYSFEMKKINGRWIFIKNFPCAMGAYSDKNIVWA